MLNKFLKKRDEFIEKLSIHIRHVEEETASRDPVVFNEIDMDYLETHEHINLRWAVFENITFDKPLLGQWVTFQDTKFKNCTFRDGVIYGVLFRAAVFENCSFENMTFVGSSFLNSRFYSSRLNNVTFSHGDLRLMNLYKCKVENTSMILLSAQGLDWNNTVFNNTDIFDSILKNGVVENCKFKSCKLSRLQLDGTRFKDTFFEDTKIVDTILTKECGLTKRHVERSRILLYTELPWDQIHSGESC